MMFEWNLWILEEEFKSRVCQAEFELYNREKFFMSQAERYNYMIHILDLLPKVIK